MGREVLPLQNKTKKKGGGGRNSFSHAEVCRGRGGTNISEVVLTSEHDVLAMPKGGKGGGKFSPVFGGGGVAAKSFGPAIFPFCSPPPPPLLAATNDQFLNK